MMNQTNIAMTHHQHGVACAVHVITSCVSAGRLLGAVAAMAVAACASSPRILPDATPLAQASKQVYQGFLTTHTAVSDELQSFSFDISCPHSAKAVTGHQCFSAVWKPRMNAIRALVEYSERIARHLETAREGEPGSGDMLGAVESLFQALRLPGISGSLVDAVAALQADWKRTDQIKSMHTALAAADPHIEKLVEVLLLDLDDTRHIVSAIQAKRTMEMTLAHNDELALRRTLEARRRELARALADSSDDKARTLAELEALQKVLGTLPRPADLASRRLDMALRVLEVTRDVLAQWRQAHTEVTAALKEERPADLVSLVSLAQQIQAIAQDERGAL